MFEPATRNQSIVARTVGLYYKMSVADNYIVKCCFFSCMSNGNTCIEHNLSYLRYKFNCSIFKFDYKHSIRFLNKSTLTNIDTANLNVLKHVLHVYKHLISLIRSYKIQI